ncbi:MAG: hypothetical protein ABR592_06930 [Nitriliruptorales bacterium]
MIRSTLLASLVVAVTLVGCGDLEAAYRDCDPAYPGPCLPPPPPDLDCVDIIQRVFVVSSPDPHNFDQDGDGLGCEDPGELAHRGT